MLHGYHQNDVREICKACFCHSQVSSFARAKIDSKSFHLIGYLQFFLPPPPLLLLHYFLCMYIYSQLGMKHSILDFLFNKSLFEMEKIYSCTHTLAHTLSLLRQTVLQSFEMNDSCLDSVQYLIPVHLYIHVCVCVCFFSSSNSQQIFGSDLSFQQIP